MTSCGCQGGETARALIEYGCLGNRAIGQSGNQAIGQSGNQAIGQSGDHAIMQSGDQATQAIQMFNYLI